MFRLIVFLVSVYFLYSYLNVQKVVPRCSKCGENMCPKCGRQVHFGAPTFRPPRGVPPYYAP